MDALRYIGDQHGVEGNEFRDFVQALTPETAKQYQAYETVSMNMPELVKEAWKVIGQRLKYGVSQNYSRRSLMKDIGGVLDHFLFS